ncbi:reverse transcriptase domain-containing protein [Tanacetum coccineum]
MAESGEEKTAFHTNHGVYCYTKMPFGLKNVGTTYQRLVDKAFDSQVGQNIEVYVDDLVIKSHTEAEKLRDIDETFRTLRKINMKLNPKKCTFGAVEGMFLGYMNSPEGIKPCPDKTEVVLQLSSSWIIKEVQSLNGKLASLNRFLSKSAEKSLPLFKTLKKCIKKSDFHWTPDAKQAFKQLKQHLSELPLLVAPKLTKELIGPELNYTPIEKLVLSLVFAAKRLRRYFQAHPIAVITDQPIKQIISRPDVAGRLQKWSVMLGEHNITYRPRTSVKGHILADFLVEKPDESLPDTSIVETPQEQWTLFTNGSSCADGSSAGLILTSPEGMEDQERSIFDSRYELFHKVDKGEIRVDNRWQSGEEVRMGQHMKHSQSNGLVERANRSLGDGIKSRLGEGNKNWIEELPHVLWAHRTTIKSSHGDTPFSLTYGTEAVIPAEIGMPTYRTMIVDAVNNDEELRLNLDLLKERRECTVFRKLGPKWEGPYDVTEALRDGAYRLRSMDGMVLPRTHDAMKWTVIVSGVVPLLSHPPQSEWRHPLTKSLVPGEQRRNGILQQHLFFDGPRIFRIAYLGVQGNL